MALPIKKIAVINDVSGFGRCSLTAAIPVISALGVECCPLVTSVLSSQTGFDSFYLRDLTDDIEPCAEEWKKLGVKFDAIFSGFIASARQGRIIGRFIDDFAAENTLVVVDPVMAEDGELCKCYDDECIRAIKELCQRASIITPNLSELCILCGEDYKKINSLCESELLSAVAEMSEKQSRGLNQAVITTGITLKNKRIGNGVFENGKFNVVSNEKYGDSFSGTGDIFTSIIAAQCVKGVSLLKAVEQACSFICKAVSVTMNDSSYVHRSYQPSGTYFEKVLGELTKL